MFALAATFTIQAQQLNQDSGNTVFDNTSNSPEVETVLTQTIGDPMNGGVSCGPGGDNWFFRSYELGANGVTTDVELKGLEFFLSNADTPVELTVYAWDMVGFPGSFDITNIPTPLAIGYLEVDPSNVGQVIRAEFGAGAIANEDSTIVVAVMVPDGSGTFYLATTPEATGPTWLASEECDIVNPTSTSALGFPDAHHIVDLVIDDVLSVGSNWTSSVSVYPNPSSDVFKISLPSNVEVMNSSLVDVLGKTTGVVYNNGEMNVSSLAPGVYFMNIETNLGSYNQKVVVKQ